MLYGQISNEDVKSVENLKLQKLVESLNLELDAAKLATINEFNKNAVLQNQFEFLSKEKSALERELIPMAELRKENSLLRVRLFVWYNILVFHMFLLMFRYYVVFVLYNLSI